MAPKLARPAAAGAKVRPAPKAKGVAKARPKVRLRRRPAAAIGGGPRVDWKKGADVKLEDFPEGTKIALKGRFWEAEVEVAAEILGARIDKGERYLQARGLGTKSESVLRSLTSYPTRKVDLHLCQDPCQSLTWRDGLIHVQEIRTIRGNEEDWMDNLGDPPPEKEEEDYNQELREEAEKARLDLMRQGKTPEEKGDRKKEKKKKDEEKEKPLKIKSSSGKKALEEVFGGTALDPLPNIRKLALKKAKKVKKKGKKKKKKSSSGSKESSSSGSSSSSQLLDVEIFEGEREANLLWRRAPGALSLITIMEAQQHLLTRLGVRPDVAKGELPPILTQYYRASLQPVMTPALSRESMHWASLIDLLLQGEVARATDLACQRLKSLESYAKGVQLDISRRLELIPAEKESLTRASEISKAGKETMEEEKLAKRTRFEGGKGNKSEPSYWGGKQGGKGNGKKGQKGGDQKGKDDWKNKAADRPKDGS